MRYRGFSLIELMVTIAIVAILLAISLPSFQGSMRSNRVATGTNEFLASLSLARSEAVRSPAGAGICASTDGAACNGGSWNDGWIVWNELGGNGSPGGADERVVRHIEGIAGLDIATDALADPDDPDSTVTKILFDPRGRAGATLEFTIQPYTCPDGQTLVRELTLTATGQVRTEKAACN